MLVRVECSSCGHFNVVDPAVIRRDRCGRCATTFDVPGPPPERTPPPRVVEREPWGPLLAFLVFLGVIVGSVLGVAVFCLRAFVLSRVDSNSVIMWIIVGMVLLGPFTALSRPRSRLDLRGVHETTEQLRRAADVVAATLDAGRDVAWFHRGTVSAKIAQTLFTLMTAYVVYSGLWSTYGGRHG